MRITNIYLKKLEGKGRLKAFGSITFDDMFIVRDVSIIEGSKGLFTSMPSRKGTDGKYRDIAFTTDKELRDQIQKAMLYAYEGNKEVSANA